MLILLLPLSGLGSKYPFLALGCVYVNQDRTIWSCISFPNSLFFPGKFFGQIESLDVAGVLQKAGDTSSNACTRSHVKVDYFIIPYNSILIRLSHLYQECYVHCIVFTNVREWDMWGDGWLKLEYRPGDRAWVSSDKFFSMCFYNNSASSNNKVNLEVSWCIE